MTSEDGIAISSFFDGFSFRLGITERKQDAAYFSSFLDDDDEDFFGDYDTLEEKSQQSNDEEGYQSRRLLSLTEKDCGHNFENIHKEACVKAQDEQEYKEEDEEESEVAPRCKQLVYKAETLLKNLRKEGLGKKEGMKTNERLEKVSSLLSGVEESKALLEEYQVRSHKMSSSIYVITIVYINN